MDNHPIPQDVTGFQFKLIGDMTVKQFAYLAGGAISAYIIWAFFPLPGLIKYPLAFIIAGMGAALAFLPIEGRAFDVMITNFLRALFSPNQYVFKKTGGHLLVTLPHPKTISQQVKEEQAARLAPAQKAKLAQYLKGIHHGPHSALDQKEDTFFASLGTMYNQTPQQMAPTIASPTPQSVMPIVSSPAPFPQQLATPTVVAPSFTPPPLPKIISMVDVTPTPTPKQDAFDEPIKENETKKQEEEPEKLEMEAEHLKEEIEETKKQEELQKGTPYSVQLHEKALELEKQLNETLTQKQQLEQQVATLQKMLNDRKPEVFTPSGQVVPQQTQNVKQVTSALTSQAGTPFTSESPNIIGGVIKDSRGNLLTNILIEIKDSEGNPIRAFKTNGLGQFASATPLPNGTFTLEFEDPKKTQKFDVIQITTTGVPLQSLQIISTDAREDLRKSLFQQNL